MNSTATPRFAIVTGAGSGLGRTFALRLARAGWYVGVTDRDLDAARATLAELHAAGGIGTAASLDVSDPLAWQTRVAQWRQEHPRLELLINNAGITAAGTLDGLTSDVLRRVIEVDLLGPLFGCQACHDWLRGEPRGGRVINIASIFGLIGAPGLEAYGAAKAGIVSLSESLRIAWAVDRIGITVVCPGFFPSRLLERAAFSDPGWQRRAEQLQTQARITADDVVDAALRASERGEGLVLLPARARRLWRLKRWLPGLWERWARRLFATQPADDSAQSA